MSREVIILFMISRSIFFPIRFSIFLKPIIICFSSILFGYKSVIPLDTIEFLQICLISIHALFKARSVMFGSTPLSNLYDASVLSP